MTFLKPGVFNSADLAEVEKIFSAFCNKGFQREHTCVTMTDMMMVTFNESEIPNLISSFEEIKKLSPKNAEVIDKALELLHNPDKIPPMSQGMKVEL